MNEGLCGGCKVVLFHAGCEVGEEVAVAVCCARAESFRRLGRVTLPAGRRGELELAIQRAAVWVEARRGRDSPRMVKTREEKITGIVVAGAGTWMTEMMTRIFPRHPHPKINQVMATRPLVNRSLYITGRIVYSFVTMLVWLSKANKDK